MRVLLIAFALVVVIGSPSTSHARRGGGAVLIVSGDDIADIRRLDIETAAALGYGRLGYRYERFGIFFMDLWRWGGEFVVYEGDTYASLTDEDLEALGGASVPWRYHIPPGLLIILAIIELAIVGRRKLKIKVALGVGGGLLLVALLFYIKGLDWEFLLPMFIGLHHILVSYWAWKKHRDDDIVDVPEPVAVAAPPTTTSGQHSAVTTSGQHKATVDSGAHKPLDIRPSQPIVVERSPANPLAPPVRHDDNADAPKLLR